MLFTVFLLVAAATVLLAVWLTRADADFTLLFCEKFGRSAASLQGKVVWITGASSGIGEWLSFKLAEAGAKLVISGTNQQRLQAVHGRCLELGKRCDVLMLPFDLADISCHADQVKKVLQCYGAVDVLVNNAGTCTLKDFEDYAIEEDKSMFEVNVFGHVSLTRLVLRNAKEAGRQVHIVVTSSMSGAQGSRVAPVYAATKHAIQGYFESLMVQGQVNGLTDVTIVCPGPVLTPMTESAQQSISDEPTRKVPGVLLPERCAELMSVAIANKLQTVWICENPVLVLFYCNQYLPSIFQRYIVAQLPWNKVQVHKKDA
ncbi:dehydrogenase/reductase SDR family member 7 [Dermacentor silvarum]|uniref:dehydrogenase/reductase SDR family member 7 n=1 Tax=Dermacentor silvarum TaxID=543639 RepID=UPI0018992C34|nr:dehydrogenase/reductase SDR family member 7 [Dermacentor silvarum]